MESKACCHMGLLTVTYYLWTTFIAVVVGIVLVVMIKPGFATDMESTRLGGGPVMTSADALLDLVRYSQRSEKFSFVSKSGFQISLIFFKLRSNICRQGVGTELKNSCK